MKNCENSETAALKIKTEGNDDISFSESFHHKFLSILKLSSLTSHALISFSCPIEKCNAVGT